MRNALSYLGNHLFRFRGTRLGVVGGIGGSDAGLGFFGSGGRVINGGGSGNNEIDGSGFCGFGGFSFFSLLAGTIAAGVDLAVGVGFDCAASAAFFFCFLRQEDRQQETGRER